MQSLHLINACVGHVTASARLCRYNTDLRHCGGGLTVTHKRAVDLTIKDANSCHCPDPFQLLPSDTFSPDVGCVQIQSCPVFLSLCPCSVGVGLGLFFWGSCLSSHRVQVLDSTQKTRPWNGISLVSIQVLRLILPASVLKQSFNNSGIMFIHNPPERS